MRMLCYVKNSAMKTVYLYTIYSGPWGAVVIEGGLSFINFF